MFSIRAVTLVLAGGLVVGCQTQQQTPKASVAMQPVSESTVADLEQSWKASHPGTQIGHLNAVDPGRRIASATGLPLTDIHTGDVVTILLDTQGASTIPAIVFGKSSGYVQLDYGPIRPGQSDPQIGSLVIWYPGGQAVPTASDSAAPPATAAPAPATEAPPATPPATTPPPPATETPAPGAAAPTPTPAPPVTETPPPPPPAPGNKVPADLNK